MSARPCSMSAASVAVSGQPCAGHSPTWTSFETGAHILRLDEGRIDYFDANAKHHCSFWQKLYPVLLGR